MPQKAVACSTSVKTFNKSLREEFKASCCQCNECHVHQIKKLLTFKMQTANEKAQ